MSPRWIRATLTGAFYADMEKRLQAEGSYPLEELPYEQLPAYAFVGEESSHLWAEAQRLRALVAPILDWADRHDVERGQADWDAMFKGASDTERHAARRLGVEPAQVKLSARVLWDHREFDDERDRRVGDIVRCLNREAGGAPGLVTREMLAELRAFLDEAYADCGEKGDGER